MKLSTQRNIDRWLGIPLCWLFSIFNRKKPFKPERDSVRNVLVILLSELGSLVLSYPMIKRLQSRYPDASIYFLVFAQNAEALDILNVIPQKNILTIRPGSFFTLLKDIILNLLFFRKHGIDVVIDCELFSRISSLFAFLTGARIIVGFHPHQQEGLYRGNYINRPVLYNPYVHIAAQFVNLADAVESKTTPPGKNPASGTQLTLPEISPESDVLEYFRGRLSRDFPGILKRKIVLIYPGGGQLPIRAWPLRHYAALGKKLLESGLGIGIIGLDTDKGIAANIVSRLNNQNVFDLTGYTKTLKELLCLFHIAFLLVTNDGGPGHLASLISLPAIVLYGPETPALYGTLSPRVTNLYAHFSCSPCLSAYNHRNTPCDGNNLCLKSIYPEQVFFHAMKSLSLTLEKLD